MSAWPAGQYRGGGWKKYSKYIGNSIKVSPIHKNMQNSTQIERIKGKKQGKNTAEWTRYTGAQPGYRLPAERLGNLTKGFEKRKAVWQIIRSFFHINIERKKFSADGYVKGKAKSCEMFWKSLAKFPNMCYYRAINKGLYHKIGVYPEILKSSVKTIVS